MNKFAVAVQQFVAQEEGVTMIEYGLLAALIAVVSIAAITTLGTTIRGVWSQITTAIAAA